MSEVESQKKDLEKLNRIYKDSEDCDRAVFAEMRSAVLLVAGEHYSKKTDRILERLRDSKSITHEQKIRLTKNHTQKIVKAYVNQIVTSAPGVRVFPQLETELQDKKAAEMHQAVWEQGKIQNDISETGKVLDWADDMGTMAECWTKIWFDPSDGDLIGYDQLVSEDGEPLFKTQDGQMITEASIQAAQMIGAQIQAEPAPDMSKPIKTGALKFEDYHAFNVLRDPSCKKLEDSSYFILRKMSKISDLKKQWPDKAQKIQGSEDKTYLVFDVSSYGYRNNEKDETLVKEYYYKPCAEYPNGYYYICTEDVVLDEGELPKHGETVLFPVIGEIFDRAPTTPRGVGIVKHLRPYQVEINRAASKIAEHQMTLGDDKLVTLNGSKVSSGATLSGVRELKVTGQPPIILEGRNGAQYVEYMLSQIEEMYAVAGVQELFEKNQDGQFDVYSMLFQAARKKQFFQRHVARFEKFLKKVCETYLEFARYYLNDEAVIYAVGRRERVNIPEFKNAKKLYYSIKVEPQTADIETQMGKQVVASQIMQYVGNKMSDQAIGKLIKSMPFADLKDAVDDYTLDTENADNLILALERGEMPAMNPADNAEYMLKRLNHRMGQADFQFLHEFIKGNYEAKKQEYMQIMDQQRQQLLAEQAQRIPASGPMVPVDFYVQYDSEDPTKTRRARIPNSALEWLIERLQEQGTYVDMLGTMPQGLQAELAGISQQQSPQGMGGPLPDMGAGPSTPGMQPMMPDMIQQ